MPVVKKPQEMPPIDQLISEIISQAEGKVGMILTHVGVVRATSRQGKPVKKVRVSADAHRLAEILALAQNQPGIFKAEAYVREGELSVGEVLMVLIIAGDFRENVFETLKNTLNAIKAEVTSKQEI